MKNAFLILTALLMISCTAQDFEDPEIYFSAAYPPFACEGLEPDHMVIQTNKWSRMVRVKEVEGGLVSESFPIPADTYEVLLIQVFNDQNEMTHKVESFGETDDPYDVVRVPFTLFVHEDTSMVGLSINCKTD